MKSDRNTFGSFGASLIELLVVMAIVGIFARLVTLDLFRSQQRSSLTVARDSIVRDIRSQQLRAMSGDMTTAGVYVDYSIRFETNKYILFPGSVYSSDNPDNTVVPLDAILQFSSILFPTSIITFARLSGDIRSYAPGQDSVTLTNVQTGEHYTIQMNIRGIPSVY